MSNDIHFMRMALSLAAKGLGYVSPNPMVGCIIVKHKKNIATGYHKKFGGPHAEVDALKKIKFNATGATMYVTLEPCHHFGKTPPCVDAVIRSGVKRVVIAMADPNPLTCRKSINKLKKAGIAVTIGVCADEAKKLNKVFITNILKKRPYVIVKVAQSHDGMISTERGKQGWITGAQSRSYVQKLRSQVDAILVGRKTVEIDNPLLNVRNFKKRQPARVILDSKLRLSADHRVFSSPGGMVILVCGLNENHSRVKQWQNRGVQVLCTKTYKTGFINLGSALQKLYSEFGICSVLIEGGAEVFDASLNQPWVDEWQIITAPQTVGIQGLCAFKKDVKSIFTKSNTEMPLGRDHLRLFYATSKA